MNPLQAFGRRDDLCLWGCCAAGIRSILTPRMQQEEASGEAAHRRQQRRGRWCSAAWRPGAQSPGSPSTAACTSPPSACSPAMPQPLQLVHLQCHSPFSFFACNVTAPSACSPAMPQPLQLLRLQRHSPFSLFTCNATAPSACSPTMSQAQWLRLWRFFCSLPQWLLWGSCNPLCPKAPALIVAHHLIGFCGLPPWLLRALSIFCAPKPPAVFLLCITSSASLVHLT